MLGRPVGFVYRLGTARVLCETRCATRSVSVSVMWCAGIPNTRRDTLGSADCAVCTAEQILATSSRSAKGARPAPGQVGHGTAHANTRRAPFRCILSALSVPTSSSNVGSSSQMGPPPTFGLRSPAIARHRRTPRGPLLPAECSNHPQGSRRAGRPTARTNP